MSPLRLWAWLVGVSEGRVGREERGGGDVRSIFGTGTPRTTVVLILW